MGHDIHRIRRLLKGFVNREFDRIRALEHADAVRELEDLPPSVPSRAGSVHEGEPASVVLDAATARRMLGVGEETPFAEIQRTYERLRKRADPSRFPEESEEQKQALAIQRRIHRAFTVLEEQLSMTERRFRKLEID